MSITAELEQKLKASAIGLTGGIGAGKSTAASYLKSRGIAVIDADILSRHIIQPGSDGFRETVAAFGESIVGVDGHIDRPALRRLVFSEPANRELLEKIIHSRLDAALIDEMKELNLWHGDKTWFYEASLLFETGRYKTMREVWLIAAGPEVQMARLLQSRPLQTQEIEQIMARQWPTEKKASLAHIVIENNGPSEELEAKLAVELQRLRLRSGPEQQGRPGPQA